MIFNREELAMIQEALHERAVSLRASSSSLQGKYERVKDLRNRVQSHLLKDEPPITVRSPPSVSG